MSMQHEILTGGVGQEGYKDMEMNRDRYATESPSLSCLVLLMRFSR